MLFNITNLPIAAQLAIVYYKTDSRDYLGDLLGYIQSKFTHPCWHLSPKSFLLVVCLGIARKFLFRCDSFQIPNKK
jgi:hypothetical protein